MFIIESPYLHNPAFFGSTTYVQPHGNLGQLPVLTTFIPSLPANSAFRVSIHSWEQPHASRLMESLLQPDDTSMFEVRIFVDGLCVAYVTPDTNRVGFISDLLPSSTGGASFPSGQAGLMLLVSSLRPRPLLYVYQLRLKLPLLVRFELP